MPHSLIWRKKSMVANAKFDVEKYLNHGIMLKPDDVYEVVEVS